MSVSDWIGFRLCGVAAAEPSQAAETLLFELEQPRWAWDWIDRLGLPRRLFPEVLRAGTRLGALSEGAAEQLGIAPGIPVAVGGGDTQSGLLGAGVVAAGELGVIAGTSSPVLALLEEPRLDPEARLWTVPHVIPGLWAIESNGGAVGDALDWIAGLLHPDHAHPVLQLLAEAAESAPGAAGMLSTLGAERMNARQLGLPLGTLTLCPLTASDDPARRRHLARAAVEGMAYGLRGNLEQAEAAAGSRAEVVRLSGGVSRSAFFAQLLADVLDRPVEVTAAHEASALGAALCAGVGAGVFADLREAAARQVRIARRCEPQAQASALYAELYPAWSELREARAASDAKAAGLALRGLASTASSPGAAGEPVGSAAHPGGGGPRRGGARGAAPDRRRRGPELPHGDAPAHRTEPRARARGRADLRHRGRRGERRGAGRGGRPARDRGLPRRRGQRRPRGLHASSASR